MRKTLLAATMAIFTCSTSSHAAEPSASTWIALSTAIVSVGSSALVSGILLSPVLLPAALVIKSVEKNKEKKAALVIANDPHNKEVKMIIPLKTAEEGQLKAGDKLTLEKAPEGTGAYLKKEGKPLIHIVNQEDSGLSGSQPVPAK